MPITKLSGIAVSANQTGLRKNRLFCSRNVTFAARRFGACGADRWGVRGAYGMNGRGRWKRVNLQEKYDYPNQGLLEVAAP